jgi:hypothetical protein
MHSVPCLFDTFCHVLILLGNDTETGHFYLAEIPDISIWFQHNKTCKCRRKIEMSAFSKIEMSAFMGLDTVHSIKEDFYEWSYDGEKQGLGEN